MRPIMPHSVMLRRHSRGGQPHVEHLIVTPEMRLAWAIVLAASCVVAGVVVVRFLAAERWR